MTLRPWPAIEEERAMALDHASAWRRLSIVMQAVLFVLTIGGIAALYWLADELSLPKGWTTLFICLTVAETLIWRARFWRTGVEAALWIGGLFAFIFSLPSSGKPEAILVFVAAAAIAGWRVRNALFVTLAFVLATAYLIAKNWPWSAFGFSILLALVAFVALTRIMQRPSSEALWEVAVVVMPVAGYVGIKTDKSPDLRVIAIYIILALMFLAFAIRFRIRVLLLAMGVCAAIAAVEAREVLPLSNETRLIIAGTVALAIATAMMRMLRGRKHGFVVGELTQSDLHDVLSVVPAFVSVHLGDAPAAPQRVEGGGEFGGGGASGNY